VQKAPTAKQKAQQARMRECAQQSAGRTGEERNKYMSACLKAQAAAPADERKLAQQARMKSCSKEASEKKLKGAERKSYMSGCLKKS